MPANLPPQFFELQKMLSQTKDVREKIEILEEMLAICPKHKGTERVQEEIKKKIAKLKKTQPKKLKREEIYFVKQEGAGQVVIIGIPNAGKTSLTNALCNTNFQVGHYPFTTQLPQPGMLRYENILIQIVDTPPITKEFKPGWLKNLAKQANLILVLLDLENNPKNQITFIEELFNEWKIEKGKILMVGNKIDLPQAQKNLQEVKEHLKILATSTKGKIGIEQLKRKIFEALNIIRVYPKEPKKEVDFNNPFILPKGTLLIDFIKEINEEWLKRFKGAKLYRKDLKGFKIVGKEYILKDLDIIEILKES